MPVIQQINTIRPSVSLKGELPIDNEAMFKKLLADPLVSGPDMMVQGNWTQGTIADYTSMKEMTEGTKIDWDTFKQVKWEELEWGQTLGIVHGFALFGSPAGIESSFGVGDPGLGAINAGNGYEVPGRAGSASALVVDNTVVATARPGERAVAFNAPRDVAIAQLINRYDWGYQARIVASLLKNLPKLGSSGEWRVPSFTTRGPTRAPLVAYNFNYPLPLGIPMMRTVFDIKSSRPRSFTFAMRNKDGDELASADADIAEGDNQVVIMFLRVPASGMVSIDSHDTSYTITDTDVLPPILGR